jgi:hypothetical protein
MIATLLLALQASSAPATAPLVSVRMTPDTVGVGEAITIELRVRAPAGSEVRFPAVPDSSENVEALDPRMIRDASTSVLLDRTAVYRLIAWDTGSRVLRFGDVVVGRDGSERRYRVTLPPLRVRSILPTDSLSRQPRRARDLLAIPFWWWRLAVGGVVVVALVGISWRAWRRRRDARVDLGPDAATAATERFAHAEALDLLEAGELGRHALAHVDVMREYLAARFPAADRSRTGHELVAALAGADFPILPERVRDLLVRSEPIAFARAPVTPVEAREIAAEARAIVKDVETAVRSRAHAAAQRPRQRRRR